MNNTFTVSTNAFKAEENANSASFKLIDEDMQELYIVSVPFKNQSSLLKIILIIK